MSEFQPPVLNDVVCRAPTDKQTHKHTHTHTHKHTYRVKTEETFFYGQFFYFLFFFLYLFECKKDGFQLLTFESYTILYKYAISIFYVLLSYDFFFKCLR